ncbi:hypothetical protein Ocin01_15791 [Orchesella cincta]|uniref:Uncharacterized protein n=1 Tax=Orchesella cincta TaxID=48709 RepID=A0A1D2MD64_ORCCI|nr:hypothetical protein Ocin01_15791 [Orchesella cincta]
MVFHIGSLQTHGTMTGVMLVFSAFKEETMSVELKVKSLPVSQRCSLLNLHKQ